jgi:hypothetical protein
VRDSGVAVCVSALLLAAPAAVAGGSGARCGDQPPAGFGETGSTTYTGAFHNRDFCFSAKIPPGLTGHGNGLTEKGFGLVVPPEPAGYLYVGADPNSWDAESAEQEARRHIDWITGDAERLLSAKTEKATLGGLPAARAVVHYHCPGSTVIYVAEYVVALSPSAGTIFSLSLHSREAAYAEHREVLQRVEHTWRFERIPANPRCVGRPAR